MVSASERMQWTCTISYDECLKVVVVYWLSSTVRYGMFSVYDALLLMH
jgi:hypothetical protein